MKLKKKNTFGTNLSVLRNGAGLSQEMLAEQLGVSRQAVSNWERNLSEPDVSSINRIAKLFNVPVLILWMARRVNEWKWFPKSIQYLWLSVFC